MAKSTLTASPSTASPPSNQTLTFTDSSGYRYSVASSPLTSTVQIGAHSAAPGHHFLSFTLTLKNLQSDRSAPNPFRGANPHPQLLAPRHYVAAYAGAQNLPCYSPTEEGAASDPLRGDARDLCYAEPTNGFAETHLDTTTDLDAELPPDGVEYITYTSQEFPDTLPASAVSVWVTDTIARDAQSGAVSRLFKRIPIGALVQTDGDPGSSPTG